ncbi:MAG: TlpA disulfide reductase family protein [Candidatus Omnitrophica bacterium]|nr:TlpA disulfide reductase family protein [Candidatus Omnitrophota bacterium]
MKKYIKTGFILATFLFISIACAQDKGAPSNQGEVLDFTFNGLNQNTVSLASFRDKQPVILIFWTTWCPYCRKELQSLNTRFEELSKEGWGILAVDAGEDAHKVESYRDAHGIKLDLLLDRDMKITNSLEILGVPSYVIINKKGYLVAKAHTFSPEKYKYLLDEK